jgi:RNA polymerase sigma-70 factor, ECF subfamily
VVQEAWERAQRVDPDAIDRPAAWLTTVVSRLALDHLRAGQRRRESYVGPWLAEPVLTGGGGDPARSVAASAASSVTSASSMVATDDPAEVADLADSLTFGFLRLLEALSPVERAVFVLADVFAVPFPDIARAVDRSPAACRQIASRARDRVRDRGRRHQRPSDAGRVADDLVAALTSGDVDQVMSLLAPDVVVLSDGGPDMHAARRPVVGSHRAARLMANLARRTAVFDIRYERAEVNGEAGAVVYLDDTPVWAASIEVVDGRVSAVHTVVNPDKLAALALDGPII